MGLIRDYNACKRRTIFLCRQATMSHVYIYMPQMAFIIPIILSLNYNIINYFYYTLENASAFPYLLLE